MSFKSMSQDLFSRKQLHCFMRRTAALSLKVTRILIAVIYLGFAPLSKFNQRYF